MSHTSLEHKMAFKVETLWMYIQKSCSLSTQKYLILWFKIYDLTIDSPKFGVNYLQHNLSFSLLIALYLYFIS